MQQLNSENFESVVSNQEGLFIIKFFSPTCAPCSTLKPVVEKLEQNNPEVEIFEVDTSESPELAAHFGVRGVPYLAYCENREVIYDFTGVTPLADLQFVIDNIDNEHFRATGQFEIPESNTQWGLIIGVGAAILFLVVMGIFYS